MKPFGHPGSISRSSNRRCEDQGRAVPVRSCRELVLDLAPAMFRQRAKRPRREVYGSAAARRLGLDENVAATCVALEGAIPGQPAAGEVDIAPEQSEALTEAEPGCGQEHP